MTSLRIAAGARNFALAAALSAGCGGESLQLEKPGQGSDPATFIENQSSVSAIAVDDLRIYWATRHENAAALLRGCKKADCERSRLTYAKQRSPASDEFTALAVGNATLYWSEVLPAGLESISACSVEGCPEGPTTIVPTLSHATSLAVDDAFVYWTAPYDTAIFRCSIVACQTPTAVALTQPEASTLTLSGENAYWISNGRVMRARKDGSEAPLVLVETPNANGLALNSTDVFWTHGAESGKVSRCPLSGSAGTPSDLVTDEYYPVDLRVDDVGAYWLSRNPQLGGGSGTLRGVELAAGAAAALHPEQPLADRGNALAIDSEFVYWVAATQPPKPGWAVAAMTIFRQAR